MMAFQEQDGPLFGHYVSLAATFLDAYWVTKAEIAEEYRNTVLKTRKFSKMKFEMPTP